MAATDESFKVIPPKIPPRDSDDRQGTGVVGARSTEATTTVDLSVSLRTPTRPAVARSMYELLLHEYITYLAKREPVSRGTRLAYFQEIEEFGRSIGRRWMERLMQARMRTGTPLDVFKFICREAWTSVYGKPIDRLRTDHGVRRFWRVSASSGGRCCARLETYPRDSPIHAKFLILVTSQTVFQLLDNAFPLLANLSVAPGATDGGRRQSLAMLAAGHLNGMLAAFGYEGHTVHSHVEGNTLKLEVTMNL